MGEGIYIGRAVKVIVLDVGRRGVSLRVEAPDTVAVTATTETMEEHVEAQREAEADSFADGDIAFEVHHVAIGGGLFIGNGVTVRVVRVEADGFTHVSIHAPKHVAVSRDDFTLEQHMEYQARRERGEAVIPGRA
jgi:sRNA-binding carbon storage regulator CsrA